MNKKIRLLDTTLREGEQQRGIHFPLEAKIEIISALEKYGFADKYEIHCYTGKTFEEAKRLVREFGAEKFLLHHRCFKEDVDISCKVGAPLSVFIGVSDLHLKAKGMTREGVLRKIDDDLTYAEKKGVKVEKIALEDATRADPEFLKKVIEVACEHGVKLICICDTVGVANPYDFENLLWELSRSLKSGSEFVVHCHNDMGLSLANCLAAYRAGVRVFTVSWHGYGERAGITPAEQLIMLFKTMGILNNVRTEGIAEISRLVSRYSGIYPKPHDPIVGDNAFTHKAGAHADKVRRMPQTYEPYPPEMIGRKRRIVLSHIAGKSSVYLKLKEDYGIEVDEETAKRIAEEIRAYCAEIGSDPSDPEVEEVIERVLGLKRGELMKRRRYPQLIRATILINVKTDSISRVAKEIRRILPEAVSIEETLGEYDLIVQISASSFYQVDMFVDLIREIDGVEKTTTVVATKKWK